MEQFALPAREAREVGEKDRHLTPTPPAAHAGTGRAMRPRSRRRGKGKLGRVDGALMFRALRFEQQLPISGACNGTR